LRGEKLEHYRVSEALESNSAAISAHAGADGYQTSGNIKVSTNLSLCDYTVGVKGQKKFFPI